MSGQPRLMSLDGEWRYLPGNNEDNNYYKPDIDDNNWRVMVLPSNWFLNGQKEYPPKEAKIDYAGVMWFRKHFTLGEDLNGKIIKLVFKGVDYFAEVWLNGHYLGKHEGYFQSFFFRVDEKLHLGQDNVIVVKVDSPFESPGDKYWFTVKKLVKGIFTHHDTRPGGAWDEEGQSYNTGGIWNNISLEVIHDIDIEQVLISPELAKNNLKANLDISLKITNYRKEEKVDLKIDISPHNFTSDKNYSLNQDLSLKEHYQLINLKMEIAKPQLWWCWDRGLPNLYRANIQIIKNNEVIATKEIIFGIRSIKVDKQYNWYLNGKRFFSRGSNYISTQWLSEMNREKYQKDIQLILEANLNFIRVHAHTEGEEFYQICDEKGLLVWQDFPLQWGYIDSKEFHKDAVSQMKEMIELFYNHPSMVVWCCHNESPWSAKWMKDKDPRYSPKQNKELDKKLYEVACSVDKTRYVHMNSGSGGDYHVYMGWYNGSYEEYRKLWGYPFPSEYGAQALPNKNTLEKMFPADLLWPDTIEKWLMWKFHNFQKEITFFIAKVPQGKDIDTFIANSQNYQAKLVKFATECYRRAKYKKVKGLFHFMFVEDWPSITWAVVDYYRQPKKGYYALQQSMQPVLCSIEYAKEAFKNSSQFKVNIWVVNDFDKELKKIKLNWKIIDKNNPQQVYKEGGISRFKVIKDASKKIFTLKDIANLPPGEKVLMVWLNDEKGGKLSENTFEFNILE